MIEVKKTFFIEEIEDQEKPIIVETKKPIEDEGEDDNKLLRKCPQCEKKTLKIENGCNSCINPECGYGKCDI